VAKIAAEIPKHFMPTAALNERVANAKKEAADVQAAFDAYKAEVEAAAAKAKGEGDESAKALEELQKKYDTLQKDFTDSQNAVKERDAKEALGKALKDAGANPAAMALLSAAALGRIQYGDDGKPSNLDEAVEAVKADNEGLFGVTIDTGNPPAKGNAPEPDDKLKAAIDKGFGDLKN
jgi:septal ring factor EnvC (AmiA/AmiB activator)